MLYFVPSVVYWFSNRVRSECEDKSLLYETSVEGDSIASKILPDEVLKKELYLPISKLEKGFCSGLYEFICVTCPVDILIAYVPFSQSPPVDLKLHKIFVPSSVAIPSPKLLKILNDLVGAPDAPHIFTSEL